jgi:hypothetical protein
MQMIAENKDYQATIRRFPGGSVEVAVSCTQHMNRMAQSRRWSAHDPVKIHDMQEMSEEQKADKAAENKARSVRRARQQVRWVNKCMQADHMVTLSYRENMESVERLKRDWRAFLKLMAAKYPGWKYLAVREYQDRGALHLHIATHGHQDIKYLRRCWYMALGASPDASGADTPGQVDVTGPSKRWGGSGSKWAADKLAAYMTKYLHKCFDEAEKGSKRYWASKGMEKPEVLKVWLGSTNFVGAIGETYGIVKSECEQVETMWASEGWQSIWMTG